MFTNRLSDRGANANAPAKLPGLQAVRAGATTQELGRAVEVLREWVEVRLGSRGDKYEKAVTLREFEQQIAPIQKVIDSLGGFDGRVETLRATEVEQLPGGVSNGAFVSLKDGRLFYGLNGRWREVQLAAV